MGVSDELRLCIADLFFGAMLTGAVVGICYIIDQQFGRGTSEILWLPMILATIVVLRALGGKPVEEQGTLLAWGFGVSAVIALFILTEDPPKVTQVLNDRAGGWVRITFESPAKWYIEEDRCGFVDSNSYSGRYEYEENRSFGLWKVPRGGEPVTFLFKPLRAGEAWLGRTC